MARKPLTKPRKYATQERSRVTVDALIEATARILVADGYDKASTNRIAAKAGVSVGSLYQYFPSKEALVAAVAERHGQALTQLMHHALAQVETLPIREGVPKLVAAAIAAHRLDPQLHCVLAEQLPHTGRPESGEYLARDVHLSFRAYLEAHRDEVRITDLELATFVCATSIEALTHTAVLRYSDRLSDAAFALLVDEASRLIVRYLQ
ncbi:TetR/AcrR family transcriptional regulator [Trinickia caryophylli]|uniref:Transcriptional regulator, TetR family n=1 Tax=Trinickia caryophylli TaxID=28094 RepID=A0A1X7DGT2_TRICW|nr:TetR/AcrR family transcriptional regulator [Trinickia caryophylli]PMS12375.1 TetR/AcrR family transcriptional regulator [Trinickia caryophylli]TRX16950.1 TetR/AcrR family transcriptional regulator [Trinickia caryophylli]WQE12317.1 TetR/AcrR family transcriptional regulator [Trinickia caryophylli]SMF15180.1 transcriptional regulator, TetR family [Trinickia caryophylli]GLU31537.1 TetR family transcriptional regulator [Trinickia caryophylli]